MSRTQSKRRRLQFGLGTLLLATAVVACWLGWNVHVVKQRSATRQALVSFGCEIDDEYTFPTLAAGRPDVPLVRRLLGDRAVWAISFAPACPRELIDRFDHEFPEAPKACRVY